MGEMFSCWAVKIVVEFKKHPILTHAFEFKGNSNLLTGEYFPEIINMLVKNHGADVVCGQDFLAKALLVEIGHPGMAHKADISVVAEMPVGIQVVPTDFEGF
jgi:hypothetical protein